jgi:hypothetical protein
MFITLFKSSRYWGDYLYVNPQKVQGQALVV